MVRPRARHLPFLLALASCNGAERDAVHRAEVTRAVKGYLATQIDAWLAGAEALQRAAPLPPDRGWDRQADAAAIAAMKEGWRQARWAYELIEGALAPLFPESDTATDARYDDHLGLLGAVGDAAPFDGEGVIGMHGLERVLHADEIPAPVLAFEQGLPGFRPAAMPATAAEARAFKDQLAGRLVSDIRQLKGEFAQLDLDLAFAFRGLLDLVEEQVEKVDKTASGEEESRYAQVTLRDLRANLQGARDVYELFRPWLLSRLRGAARDEAVLAAFARLRAAYDAHPGDRMPPPPPRWSATQPSGEDLQSDFGRLYTLVKRECDPAVEGSLHAALRAVAEKLGLPEAL